jgi:hypothetical protein
MSQFCVRSVFAVVGVAAAASVASATLTAGSLMPIAVNTAASGGTDGFAVVALADIAGGSVVYITDNELTSVGATTFNTGESYSKWTAPAGGITAGTVINFNNFDVSPFAVNLGTLSAVTFSGNTNRGLSATTDSIYLYLAAGDASVDTPTSFISILSIGNAVDGFVPSSLGNEYAVQIVNASGPDSAQYTGPRANQVAFSDYVNLIDDIANWTPVASGTNPNDFNTTAFTLVPAPASAALLGLAGLVATRRRRN